MKRKFVSLMLATAMTAAVLAGCGGDGGDGGNDGGSQPSDEGTSDETGSGDQQAPEDEGQTPSAGGGSVYLLNFKPESNNQWQKLAETYTEQTGVSVTVLTAAEGTYSQTQQAEMAKGDEAPTIFNIGNATAAQT